jgi:Na+/H+ antiporter NhaA
VTIAPRLAPDTGAHTSWSGPHARLRTIERLRINSAAVLLAAAVSAVLWANLNEASYEGVWRTMLSIELRGAALELDLRHWLNSGLMTFYFFVFGLEARRELDLGEFRERRRVALPVFAALAGMTAAALIYLALNLGDSAAHGWGIAMSTDTAFALGLLALVGPRFPTRLRTFMLTIVVVDDVIALLVITTVYTDHVHTWPLILAVALFAIVVAMRHLRVRRGPAYAVLGAAIWVALVKSGVEPVVVGLAMGLVTYAYPAGRHDLERATAQYRRFREQPTSGYAQSARESLRTAISPNDRLLQLYHPLTSYAVVPLFALANAGIVLDRELLARGLHSPITIGILLGYVIGKPLGILVGSWSVTRISHGRVRPSVGWVAVAGAGTLAGVGFTVSLLVAALAFIGPELEEAKLGILGAAVTASTLTGLLFLATSRLPERLKVRTLLGAGEPIQDLVPNINPERDHIRGPANAAVTIVEYGDFECPYCGQAETVLRQLLREFGDVRYVWRHLPLNDVHPNAELAAEAAEAAAAQGAFWQMHKRLLDETEPLDARIILRHADALQLDTDRMASELVNHTHAQRVAENLDSADRSGVSGTPTFFINGRRHEGPYDLEALSTAVRAAGARSLIAA